MLTAIEPHKLRVLVVDDDLDTVDSTATLFRLYGSDVKTAVRGADAVACAARFQPEVVMLDVGMPGMDGYQTAREIQRLALPRPPVLVAVSGYGDTRARYQAAEAGFDLHLLKPVEPNIFEELQVLVEETERASTERVALRQNFAQLTGRHNLVMLKLVLSFIQTCHTLLHIAKTTAVGDASERCISNARRICDRLTVWVERYPEQFSEVRPTLEDLIRSLRR